MKIVVLANSDIASQFALEQLMPRLEGHEINVWLSSAVGGSKKRAAQLEALKAFEQQARFDRVAAMTGTEPRVENAINGEAALARLKVLAPDLIISIRYGGILKSDVIAVPRCGVINLHSGKLPDYRGVMASFWAMLNNEREIGATLHFISDATIDTGGVIDTVVHPVNYETSYLENVLALYPAGVALIADTVSAIAGNRQPFSTRQEGEGSYYTFPTEVELEAFEGRGLRLFDDRVLELISSCS